MAIVKYVEWFNPQRLQIKCCMEVKQETDQRGRDKRLGKACRAYARLTIDGKGYCIRHA